MLQELRDHGFLWFNGPICKEVGEKVYWFGGSSNAEIQRLSLTGQGFCQGSTEQVVVDWMRFTM